MRFSFRSTGGNIEPLDAHLDGPLIYGNFKKQYRKYNFENYTLTTSIPNNCCIINSAFVLIENFAETNKGSVLVIGRKLVDLTDLFSEPCSSIKANIYCATNLSALLAWPVIEIQEKCMCLPLPKEKKNFAVIPCLHTALRDDEFKKL